MRCEARPAEHKNYHQIIVIDVPKTKINPLFSFITAARQTVRNRTLLPQILPDFPRLIFIRSGFGEDSIKIKSIFFRMQFSLDNPIFSVYIIAHI